MKNVFDQMADGSGVSNASDIMDVSATSDADASSKNSAIDEAANRTAADVRIAVQELWRQGYLEESRKPDVFRKTIIHELEINRSLEPLDLAIKLDTHRGIALLVVRPNEEDDTVINESDAGDWSHPLVRRQRLTLEQSLVIAILRGAFVLQEQESGVGQKAAKMPVDDLLPVYLSYIEDSGSDARNETKLMHLLEQLKGYGIVSEVDKNQEITIRPLIAHLANPESLEALLQTMTQLSQTPDEGDS